MYVDFDAAGKRGRRGVVNVEGAPASVPGDVSGGSNRAIDNYQKLLGLYLLATARMAILESDSIG